MSKTYEVDMNIETKDLTPNGGMLMMAVDKEVDPRGFRERSGAEVFALIAGVAINGANPKCSYDQLKSFRRIVEHLNKAAEVGIYISNKTDLDIIKNSIKGNQGWPNQDEVAGVLDAIIAKIDGAKENGDTTPNNPGPDPKQEK